VLPESADRASIARGVGQASNLFPRFFAFAWPGACRENHGVFQVRENDPVAREVYSPVNFFDNIQQLPCCTIVGGMQVKIIT
jgi:hypothetical protein